MAAKDRKYTIDLVVRTSGTDKLKSDLGYTDKALDKVTNKSKALGRVKVSPMVRLMDKISAPAKRISTSLTSMSRKAWSVTVSIKDRVTKQLGNIKNGLGKLGSMITSPLAMVGLVGGGVGATALAKDFVMTAGRTETSNIAMNSVAKATNTAMDSLLAQKKAVMDLGIAEQEATQVMTRFMQGHLDIAQAAKVARTAQDAAVIAGVNSSEATEVMVEAIAKLRPELLDQFGMTKNLLDIYNDHAQSLGIVATTYDKYGKAVRHMKRDMTDTEKKQAVLNYILSEGAKIAGTYEASLGSAFKKLGSLKRYWDTFKNMVGERLLLPAFGTFVDRMTESFKNSIKWVDANGDTLERWGRKINDVSGRAADAIMRRIGGAFSHINRKYLDNPDFQVLDLRGKIKFVVNDFSQVLSQWVTGTAIPAMIDQGVPLGKALIESFASAASSAVIENKLLALLLGAYVGLSMPGPIQLKMMVFLGITMAPWVADLIDWLRGGVQNISPYIQGEQRAKGVSETIDRLDNLSPGESLLGETSFTSFDDGGPITQFIRKHTSPKDPDDNSIWGNFVEKLRVSKWAKGGILTKPHLGMVAEAGPEAVIPLRGNRHRALSLYQEAGERLGITGGPMVAAGGGGGMSVSAPVNISMNQPIDRQSLIIEIGTQIVDQIEKAMENRG